MLEPDILNIKRNPDAKLRTHVKPGDVVIIYRHGEKMKIMRPDKKRFIDLSFQTFSRGFPVGEEKQLEIIATTVDVYDFFRFLLSVTNLVAEKIKPGEEGFHETEERWILDEHPDDKYHG